MEFEIKVDVSEITNVLDKINIKKLAMEALEDGGDKIHSKAKDKVHVISGDLRASGRVDKTSNSVTVAFTKDYADLEEKRVGGRYAGSHAYLEPSGNAEVENIAKDIEDKITEALNK